MAEDRTSAAITSNRRLGDAALWVGAAVIVLLVAEVAPLPWSLFGSLPGQDYAAQDTYYVVASGHYDVSLAIAMVVFAIAYWLLDKLARAPRRPRLRLAHLGLMLAGALLIVSTPLGMSLSHVPRRGEDLPNIFAIWNWVSLAGYALTLAGLAVFAVLVADAIRHRLTSPAP